LSSFNLFKIKLARTNPIDVGANSGEDISRLFSIIPIFNQSISK